MACARHARSVFCGYLTLVAVLAISLPAKPAQAQAPQPAQPARNPYSPAYGHPYRHGVVPTREALGKIRAWESSHRSLIASTTTASDTLAYGGGIGGAGVVSGSPKVYLVFWGSQWTGSGDPNGAATYLQHLFAGIGTGGELWSGTMTEYCDGSSVANGATSCPSGAPHVGYPSGSVLAGVWFDTAAAAPNDATSAQIAAEAVAAAAHFGNTSAASNRYAQYFVVSPSGTHPDNFGLSGTNFCAWHNFTSSSYGNIAYTNMPYVSDLGSSCGENFVNSGSAGTDDGFSIVAGHEYAETLTDMLPAYGWSNHALNDEEDGDECAWISSGQGAAADVSMGNGTYAMQSTWSNDTNQCDISHEISPISWTTPQITFAGPAGCNGSYELDWTATANTTLYQLWVKQPTASNFTKGKSTTGTTVLVKAPYSQPTDFEVQSCNAQGCSDRSGFVGLTYYSGCP